MLSLLACLGSATEQDDQRVAIATQVDPVAGSGIDPVLEDASPDASGVGQVAQRHAGQRGRDLRGGPPVQAIEPPRARGERAGPEPAKGGPGCIPAAAGSFGGASLAPFVGVVHPRVCGAGILPFCGRRTLTGLSPRGRGNHSSGYEQPPGIWSIPATAGQALPVSASRRAARVHPRSRGATPVPGDRRCVRVGFIPACAGKRA